MERTKLQLGDYCFFCHGRREGINVITQQYLCNEHLKMVDDMAGDFFYSHPDGICTPNCGCISLDELLKKMETYDTPI